LVRFWDTSAIVPLVVREAASDSLRSLYRDDPLNVVWWSCPVECSSAVARREREGAMELAQAVDALRNLDAIARTWIEVRPVMPLRDRARRLLRVHPLRAADALQLAAALAVGSEAPEMEFVCLDRRLVEAALREGLRVATLPTSD
jgi:predicted nucleic acid-binding protein